jgi:cytochrome c-type biogenesis protein CcmH/NrfF
MIIRFHISIFLIIATATSIAICLFPVSWAHASDKTSLSEETLVKTQEISDSIMSPYCPGRTLSACPSDKARNLRNEISVFFERGYSREAVVRQLTAKYGSAIKGEPESDGLWILAWMTPFVIILLACFFIAQWIKKHTSRTVRDKSAGSDKIIRELEGELKNRLQE